MTDRDRARNEAVMKLSRVQGVVLLVSALLTACNVPAAAPAADPSRTPETTPEMGTPTPGQHAEVLQPANCPIPAGDGGDFRLENGGSIVQDILAYLNGGGSIATVRVAIRNWNNSQPQDTALLEGDFDGDGFLDAALAVRITDTMPLENRIFTLQCSGDQYRLQYISPALSGSRPAVLHTMTDFSGDGLPDVLAIQESCGAHTCSLQPLLLTWSTGSLSDRWVEPTNDIPSPLLEVLHPPDRELPLVAITATGIASAGAGPLRAFRREYSWDSDSQAMVFRGENTLPAMYRIHVLFDGDRAYLEADFVTALQAYQRAIEDVSLSDWVYGNDGYARLSAYALFRSMLVHIRLGELDLAGDAFQLLREAYTAGAGQPFAEMAGTFWDAYLESGELNTGCLAAQTYAEQHPETILDALYYGYANPAYTVGDICPLVP